MLSPRERLYLQGKLKNLTDNYHRNLNCKIRKKLPQAMKDLTLIFESPFLNATNLHFYKKQYFELAHPLLRAITQFELKEHFFEDVKLPYLSSALERAGKRHDYKRLVIDEKYKQRMIDWLVKNGIEFWNPPKLEEQRRRYEKLFKGTLISPSEEKI